MNQHRPTLSVTGSETFSNRRRRIENSHGLADGTKGSALACPDPALPRRRKKAIAGKVACAFPPVFLNQNETPGRVFSDSLGRLRLLLLRLRPM